MRHELYTIMLGESCPQGNSRHTAPGGRYVMAPIESHKRNHAQAHVRFLLWTEAIIQKAMIEVAHSVFSGRTPKRFCFCVRTSACVLSWVVAPTCAMYPASLVLARFA